MIALLESFSAYLPAEGSPTGRADAPRKKDPENQVCNYVLERIVAGEYLPGQHINEFDIARTLRLTKEQVREAMREMIRLGLVERIPNKGVRMKHISLRDLEDIFQSRLSIELETLRHVAGTITDEQLAELKVVSDQCVYDETLHDYAKQFDTLRQAGPSEAAETLRKLLPYYGTPIDTNPDLRFHLLLVRYRNNKVWTQMALTIIPRAMILFQHYFFLLPHSIIQVVFQHIVDKVFATGNRPVPHSSIYAALVERDAKRAEELMHEHLRFCYLINRAKIELYEDIARDQKLIGGRQSPVALEEADDDGLKKRKSRTSVGTRGLRGRRP